MSRFFAASDSDSSSESSDSEDQQAPLARRPQAAAARASAFAFSDDEDDAKRVVRSAKEKRHEQLNNIIKTIRNSKKIKDFNKMESSFAELRAAYEKAKAVILKEDSHGQTPRFYLRILVEVDDLINETWEDKEYRKKMSKINAKSLGALRQNLRKYVRENFEEEVAKFRENPDAEDEPEQEEADEEEDSESDDENEEGDFKKSTSKSREGSVSVDKKGKKKAAMDDDEESDDSYWDSDSDESSSSSDDDPGMSLREKFLKRPEKESKKKEKKAKPAKKSRKALRDIDEDDEDDEEGEEGDKGEKWITVDHGGLEKPKMFDKDAEINHEAVVKKLQEIMSARGKKRTNRKEQIELLSELLGISEEHELGVAIYVKIQFAIISAIYDYNPKVSSAMKSEYWEKCMPAVEKLLIWLKEHAEDLSTGEHVTDDQESVEEKPYLVRGCYLSVVERMDDEFVKVLKGCDAHTHEYVERLKDEPKVMHLLEAAKELLEVKGAPAADLCRIYVKKMLHIYFKFDDRVIKQKQVRDIHVIGEFKAKMMKDCVLQFRFKAFDFENVTN